MKYPPITSGTAKLVKGRAVVFTSMVTRDTRIFLAVHEADRRRVKHRVWISYRSTRTGFEITSAHKTDKSKVSWLLIEASAEVATSA